MRKKLWQYTGLVGFWLAYPLLVVYLPLTKRTRIVVRYQDKILVVKGWLGNGKWELPGGGLHRSESPNDGAARELREETKLDIDPERFQLLGEQRAKGVFKYISLNFYIEVETPFLVRPQRGEIIDVQWISVDTLDASIASKELLTIVSAWRNKGSTGTM